MARVDGLEITRRDVLIELIASGAPADVDTQTAQPALLDRIIVRKLMAQEAHRQLVDRSPEFLGQERRSREVILGEQLAQRIVGRLTPPSPRAIARFVAENAGNFNYRRILRIDRIAPVVPLEKEVARLGSNDLIARQLQQQGIAYRRMLVDVDSMTVPAADLTALDAAGDRPVMIIGADNTARVDQVLAVTQQPVHASQQAGMAKTILQNRKAQQAVTALVTRLRRSTSIDYAVE